MMNNAVYVKFTSYWRCSNICGYIKIMCLSGLTYILQKQMFCAITRDQTQRMTTDTNIYQYQDTLEESEQREDGHTRGEIEGGRGQQERKTDIHQTAGGVCNENSSAPGTSWEIKLKNGVSLTPINLE